MADSEEYSEQCHYFAIRDLARNLDIPEDKMGNFPTCERDGDCPHYHLPKGPFLKDGSIQERILEISRCSGEIDHTNHRLLSMKMVLTDGSLSYSLEHSNGR